MAFPITVLDTDVELYINGAWVSAVRLDNGQAGIYGEGRSEVTIQRGRKDEQRPDFDVSQCSFQLNNRDGRFSPRNPTGPYFGFIGRNTPVRVSVPAAEAHLALNGEASASASAPDTAQLSLTGDFDIRVNASMDDWHIERSFVAKYTVTGNQRSYQTLSTDTGLMRVQWSTNGTATIAVNSTSPIPFATGRGSLKWTLDVNNGLGGYTVTFYYSHDTNLATASWTQLGDAVVTTGGTTSVFNSTALAYVGDNAGTVEANSTHDRFYSAEIRSVIDGTVVANPNFAIQAGGAASFADTAGTPQTWTINAPATIEDRDYRFYGEMAEWPLEWDTSGNDVWIDASASGIFRRMGQGSADALLGSAMFRSIVNNPNMVAYWPAEDGTDAERISSAAVNGRAMTFGGSPEFAAYTGTFKCSNPIPNLNGSAWSGSVASYSGGGEIQLGFLIHIEGSGPANNTCVMRLFCTGTAARWDIVYGTGGTWTVEAYRGDTQILTSGPWGFNADDTDNWLVLTLDQNGSDVDWKLTQYGIGTAGTGSTGTQTLAANTISIATGVHVNPPGSAGLDDDAIGHVSILKNIDGIDLDVANAFAGETAAQRIVRLCEEEGVTLITTGNVTEGTLVGFQLSDTLLNLLKEAAAADLGWLLESRRLLGLEYLPRRSVYAQNAQLTLDYDAHQMQSLKPVDDDAATRNDVTVTRRDGGGNRVVDETTRMSIQDPPLGVGLPGPRHRRPGLLASAHGNGGRAALRYRPEPEPAPVLRECCADGSRPESAAWAPFRRVGPACLVAA
jgi:hypothetical protein